MIPGKLTPQFKTLEIGITGPEMSGDLLPRFLYR